MPFLKLSTNVAIDNDNSSKMLTGLSKMLANETGKSERYVMVEIKGGKSMSFGGNAEPLAYVECKSIGLTPSQARSISAALAKYLDETISVSADRLYIEFSNCPAEFWGWNGSTFG